MILSKRTKRWLGWGFAALIFAYVWSPGGYWHYVVVILVVVSLVVVVAEHYSSPELPWLRPLESRNA
jgi:hypothetical protein